LAALPLYPTRCLREVEGIGKTEPLLLSQTTSHRHRTQIVHAVGMTGRIRRYLPHRPIHARLVELAELVLTKSGMPTTTQPDDHFLPQTASHRACDTLSGSTGSQLSLSTYP